MKLFSNVKKIFTGTRDSGIVAAFVLYFFALSNLGLPLYANQGQGFYKTAGSGMETTPPQAKGINTEPINIEEIDPLAGIVQIKPPEANSKGSARLGYPIGIPEGINGLTPNVSLVYTSGTGFGECGEDWGFGFSSITIKTEGTGIPGYDGNDIYMLDGRELAACNSSKTIFRSTQEASFEKIEKSADRFIVYQIDGTRRYYGESDNARLYKPDNINHIYQYRLSRIVDSWGNQIEYEYDPVIDSVTGNRVNLYPKSIRYGHNSSYEIRFTWEERSDARENFISGFLIRKTRRLSLIQVRYKVSTILKSIELTYNLDDQNKSLLSSVREYAGDVDINTDKAVNEHLFTYEQPAMPAFHYPVQYHPNLGCSIMQPFLILTVSHTVLKIINKLRRKKPSH